MQIFFQGGLNVHFDTSNLTLTSSTVEEHNIKTMSNLISYLTQHFPKSNELFTGEDLKNGNLCVINESEWEVLGGKHASLCHTDSIYFISRMHGG
ncbi:ubiquitin-related modifier 1 [Hamiltosporidium tvaerminnensis]|uniref:Ubiquitin-related modifier 1 n=1 Tax=Hamiltosporidium tvaerminnensis TaxID=1176355 RepID=A0A4Q9KZ73_9MICR|nr:Ubiquitin- modifier 1 [Hamiltosporidium tvaerminnensis]TBT99964.1 ubiquitin-related modifier 1 [Hamiltosporidium tvaerminnensis]TBU11108.1 ubiquitin-related modifier 1 [Hamiltosporidium tvaerminnensis]